MSPRANFECRRCQAVYEDLPVQSVRCPVCSFKRGFRRLFDAIQVSTTGHRVAQVLDPMMRPQLEQMDQTTATAAASAKRLREEHERGIAHAPEAARPALREALAQGPVRFQPNAGAVLGGIPAQARLDSRHHLFPHLRRRVIPGPV